LDLGQLANIGEFLGGIAVIMSLVYLAVQIRQNTRSVRASTFQAATDSVTEFTAVLGSAGELSRIWVAGLVGAEPLSEEQSVQFYFLFVTIARRLESAFFQKEAGVIDEEQWVGFRRVARIFSRHREAASSGREAASRSPRVFRSSPRLLSRSRSRSRSPPQPARDRIAARPTHWRARGAGVRGFEPSQTAIVSAAFRAAHACVYGGPAIHDDTPALRLAGFEDAEQLRRAFEATGTPALPEASAYFALRHRFSEDRMAAAVDRGVRQVVLLGAGLDSLALRRPDFVADLDFFEVDHPNTQAWKLRRFEELGLARPDIRYVAGDFQKNDLRDALAAAGADLAHPTFFSWLGVTQYIATADTMRTLDLVVEAGAGSEIVFDLIVDSDGLDEHARSVNATYAAASASRGEPWISSYAPESLVRALRQAGFASVRRLTPDEAGRRYYAGQPEDVTPMQGWQLIHATT